jgi:hypothetical protein
MLKRLRERLPQDSIFRKPLVFDISVVMVIKLLLITVLWHVAFKPLKPAVAPDVHLKMGLPSSSSVTPANLPKDVNL